MSDTFEAARRHFIDGVRAFEAVQYDEARRQFEASLALVPGRTVPGFIATLARR